MKTAKHIKTLKGFAGNASLYELSEPIEYDKPWDDEDPPAKTTKLVVVSAANVMFSGNETYIFPSNEKGEIIDWGELEGSYRGGLDHTEALRNAGFEIA